MKKSILLNLFLFVGLTLCLSITVNAQERAVTGDISRTISYQGLLRTADGTSADGVHQVTVRLYADASGTEPIWQDEFTTEVSGGVFNVQMGSQKPLPASTSMNSSLWVSVQIGQTAEMHPVQMSASPYALNVANNSITADKMATNYIGSISINGQKVTGKGADVNFVAGDGLALQVDPVTNAIVVSSNGAVNASNAGKGSTNQSQPVTDVTASSPLASSGGTTPNISLTGVVAIANGGTGSSTKNFVDLSTTQSIAGAKTFSGATTHSGGISMSNTAITNLATPSASNDASTKGYVDGINTSLTASITSEAATRSANDNTLTNNLNSEIANRQTAVTGEANARIAADNALTASVTSEASARASADNTLTTNLNSEVTNRTNAGTAEASARTAADASEASARAAGDASEASARTTADNTLTASVSAETSARQTADNTLTANLNSEIANRSAAVASEASTRASADNTLTSNLNAEIARAQAAEAAFSSASITSQINSAVAAEATLRTAADATESSARTTADNTLTTNLNAEIANRAAAVTTEASARTTADNALTASLNSEITNRQAGDASEAATRASAVSTLTTNLNNEISARQSAITTEASSRTSADNALTSALQAETAARIAGDQANNVGSQDLDMQGHSIINVADPSNAQDVTTKNYVDLTVGTIFRDYTGFGDGNYTGHTSTVYGSTDNVTNLIGYSAFVYGSDDDNIGVQTTAYGQGAGNAIGGDFNAANFDGTGNAIGGRFSASGAANNIAVQATSGSIQIATAGEGMILKSPGGNCFKLTVDDDGALTTSAVTCP